MYTEEQLLKAVRYALEAQKAHDLRLAEELLMIEGRDVTEQETKLMEMLGTKCTVFFAFAMLDRDEILEHVKK